MKRFVGIHLLLTAVLGGPLWVYASGAGLSFLLGSILSLANVGALYLAWSQIFSKKNIALAISVIVFKYAILILIIFQVTTSAYLSGLWFGLGFALVGLTSLIWAVSKSGFKETPSG